MIVCPEHAIIAGDLSDPSSEAAQLVAREPVRVRKPEQGTQPKLYYIDADESAIVPTAARHESIYMWSQRNAAILGRRRGLSARSSIAAEKCAGGV